jgi:hypothetical protein
MKVKITKQEYEKTAEQSRIAAIFLESKDYDFIREYISSALSYAEKSVLENTIHDVTEEVTISDKIRKLFFTPKKEQMDELKGQYKWIKKFMEDMKYFASLKEQLDKDIERGSVYVEGTEKGKNKDVNYARG